MMSPWRGKKKILMTNAYYTRTCILTLNKLEFLLTGQLCGVYQYQNQKETFENFHDNLLLTSQLSCCFSCTVIMLLNMFDCIQNEQDICTWDSE